MAEKDPMVQLSEDLLSDYQNNYRADWVQEAIDDDAFRSNVQWSEADEKDGQGQSEGGIWQWHPTGKGKDGLPRPPGLDSPCFY